jgi:VWFA-related protein
MKRASLVVLGVLVGSAVIAPAQEPQQAPPSVFRSGVDLVRLDVRVTGADGRPVEDLRADEIEVTEEGQTRPVLLFQHVHTASGSYAEVATRTIGGEVSTNQGAPRGHLYVIIFDQHHISAGNEQKARTAAEKFLKTRLRPGDRVAIYGIPGPGPSVNFTGDAARAAAELVKVSGSAEQFGRGSLGTMRLQEAYEITRGNDDVLTRVFMRASQQGAPTDVLDALPGIEALGGLGAAGDPAVMRQLVRQDARTIVSKADESARRFLVTLADVVRALRDIEGRKAVLLFSEGFYTDNVTRELEHVAAAAAQSYSVVYGFDLNRRGLDLKEEGARGGEQFAEIGDRINPLGSLAAETDGELIIDASSQMDRAVARMADLSNDYYVVGFAPHQDAARDRGKYRRVKVTVKRDGARASTRTGYAMPGEATPADRRRAIDSAIGAPFPQQGLPVAYTTYMLRGTASGMQRVVLSVEAKLPIAAQPGATADVVFVARGARDGRIAASGTDTMALPTAPAHQETLGTSTYRVQFEVPSGDYLMRVIVREPGGLLGSADRRFTARPLDGPDVAAGDLILGSTQSSRLPVRTTAFTSEMLTGMTELYARASTQLEQVTATMELVPLGQSQAVRTTPVDVDVKDESRGTMAVAQFELPLEGVEPGAYAARVIIERQGETVAQLAREVTVLAGMAPGTREATAIAEAAPPAPNAPIAPSAPTAPGIAPPPVNEMLAGQITRNYLTSIRPVMPVAEHALAGGWDKVDAALGAPDVEAPASSHALRGLTLFAQTQYGAAAEALQTAFRKEPQNAALAFFLGWAHVGAGDERKAITAWRAAIVADQKLVPAYLALADAYLRLSQPALAGQVLRSGLTAMPRSPELLDRIERLMRER